LDAITAAKNLKDPLKISEDIAKRRHEAAAAYEESLSRAALDWNLSRIVALAWFDGDVTTVKPCPDEETERAALVEFWRTLGNRALVGFAARTFDAPTLIQRSRLLNVVHQEVNLARFGRGSVIDIRDVLTFDDARYEAVMPRSLKTFCRRFGIQVDDPIDGKQIPQLVAEGNWDAVMAHITSDVKLTVQLGQRIGVLLQPQTLETF
jgi:hypothetical protein